MYHLYTDGAVRPRQGGYGGWASIVVQPDAKPMIIHGSLGRTTSNRMELLAVISGLEIMPWNVDVSVHSDSQYVVNVASGMWNATANRDLWDRYFLVKKHFANISIQWHRRNSLPELERADELAKQESYRDKPKDDIGSPYYLAYHGKDVD